MFIASPCTLPATIVRLSLTTSLWKSIIEDFWPDFLRYFFPDIQDLIDFEHNAVFLDKDLNQLFPDRHEGDRRVDILMQVWFKDGRDHWFLVHTEVQGYDDESFARRMYLYHTRILDKHHRHLTSLVIFLNEDAAFQPAAYHHTFAGTELLLRYRTFVVNNHSYESLYHPDNPFGLVLQTAWVAIKGKHIREKQFDQWLYQQKGNLHRRMLGEGYSSKHSRRFLSFLEQYLVFRSKAIAQQFNTNILQLDPNRKPMGIIELVTEEATRLATLEGERKGEKKGEKKGRRIQMLQTMQQLILDEAGFDDARIARITGGSQKLVQTVRSRVQAGNMEIKDLVQPG